MTDAIPQAGSPPADRARALRIISALADGRNCLEGTNLYSTGRDSLCHAADEQFEELELTKGTAVRWLKGRYGDGKTHTVARLMDLAHGRNWVTSYVQISAPGKGAELSRFNDVFAAVVANCLCREMVEEGAGTVVPGRRPGWQWILAKWYDGLKAQAGGSRGDVPTFKLHDVIDQTMTGLQANWGLGGNFLNALREYAKARAESDQPRVTLLHDWFAGSDVHARGASVKQLFRGAGIMESLNKRNAKEMLRSLSAFLQYRGFGGLMIVLDEVENVILATPKARKEAYITLRELIDNADYRHGVMATCLYATGTPDLFEGAKGFSEYEALATRVLIPPGEGLPNPRATVLDLSRFPLTRSDFLKTACRISDIFCVAKGRAPVRASGVTFDEMLDAELRRNRDMTARHWVRLVVNSLQ